MIRKAEYYRASGKTGARRYRRYAIIAGAILLVAFVLQLIFRQLFFYPLTISGDSMQPEINAGDKRYFTYARLSQPKLGDVVLVQPAGAQVELLCRIVATDGDKVRITEGKLFVNGTEKRDLKPRLRVPADKAFYLAETEVRPNYVFCLNDNAQNSNDSRLHGSFARSQVTARLVHPTLFF